jgi:hypothetical protein
MAKLVNESVDPSPGIVAQSAMWKLPISFLLVLHLLAICTEPFALFTRGSNGLSPAALPIRKRMAPYIEIAYLNHGYFFFAPNPSPSHLLECSLKSSNGEQSRLRLPDRRAQWPRLLYHRHFMLAEFLHQLHVEPISELDVLNAADKELLNTWQAERTRFEMVRDSMIKHLKHRYSVDSAEIFRLEHRLPSDVEVFRDKIPLNDERLYVVLPDAPVDAPTGAPAPESIPGVVPGASEASKPILNSRVVPVEQGQP